MFIYIKRLTESILSVYYYHLVSSGHIKHRNQEKNQEFIDASSITASEDEKNEAPQA